MVDRVLQSDRLRQPRSPIGLTSSDPSGVFAVKSLLYPVVAVLSLLACLLYYRQPLYGPNFLLAVLAFLAVAYILDVALLQRRVGDRYYLGWLFSIVRRWVLVVGFIWAMLHLSGLEKSFDARVLTTWGIGTPLALWLSQIATHFALSHSRVRHRRSRKAVIVGLTDLGLRLERQIRDNPLLDTEIVGYFEDRGSERLPAEHAHKIMGTPAALPEYVLDHGVNAVYITLPMTRHPRILDLLESLRDSTASIYFIPDLFVFDLIQARVDVIGGLPVVAVCDSPFYGAHSIAKRFSDMLIAVAALVITAPLILAVAIGVRLSSPGPVVFRQRRYGLDGREITIYKFRSMNVTEDGATQYTQVTRQDSRVTPFGAFIRRTSLDELPQLFNVLNGSLSIVGPRPHAIAVNEQYRKLIPGYMVRHKIKPGITGWAQINGYRGGDDLDSMRKRIEFDLEYLRNWSIALDLSIVIQTAVMMWKDRRAY